ncbi:hypothetical protein J7W19_29270 [Streptomyces mobaraensis NBRC 13819 = DSM 40847]|nr:hypothetical protein J7W19_29270 [Streptomyces mobaraensis NBRC 13819 = DSM 40847]
MARFASRNDDIGPGPIRQVVIHYFPHWDAPNYRSGWVKCLCPSHDEGDPSASVNYDQGCIKCQACGFKGSAYSIIMKEESCTFGEAQRRAEELAAGSGQDIPRPVRGQSGRRVFGQSPLPGHGGDRQVQAGVRRRFGS